MKSILFVLVAVSSLFFASCASVGTPLDSSQLSTIKKGQTTRSELVSKFGPPRTVGISNGKKTATWLYTRASARAESFIPVVGAFAGGTNIQQQMLVVEFDANDRVRDYSYTNSNPNVRTGASAY